MATTIVTKSGSGAPAASDLVAGELAVDLTNKRLYTENSGGTVLELGTNPTTLAVDTDTLVVDATNNRVGIGTSSIEGRLHVYNGASGKSYAVDGADQLILENNSSVLMDIRTPADATGGILFSDANARGRGVIQYSHSTDAMYFNTAGASAMTIDSIGNVGIGTSSPSAPLNISATYASDTTEQFRIQDNTGGKLDFFGYSNGGKGIQAYADDGSTFYNLNLNPLGGNVGIGTSSPTSYGSTATTLEVKGASGSGIGALQLAGADGAVRALLYAGGASEFVINTQSNHAMDFNTNNQNRMRIDASGNVGIGTSSPSAPLNAVSAYSAGTTTTSLKLATVGGYNSNSGTSIDFGQDQGNYATWLTGRIASTRTGNNWGGSLTFSTNDNSAEAALVERMRIDASGNVLVGGSSATIASEMVYLLNDGRVGISAASTTPLIVNRKTNDGDILELRKDETVVGSIGVHSSSLQIGTGNSQIKFSDSEDSFYVVNAAGAARDNSHDLGKSNARFKDLFLSGGVVLDTGGSASASTNKLDSYEEGSWTPALGGTWTTNPTSLSGTYTKVGQIVYITVTMTGGVKSSAISGYLTGVPISISSGTGSVSNSSVNDFGNALFQNGDRIWLTATNLGTGTIYISGTYLAA